MNHDLTSSPAASADKSAPLQQLLKKDSRRLQGIIFDCDGVLFDSKDANMAYYNYIRQQLNLPPMNKEEQDYSHMVSTDEVLERMFPPHLLEKALEIRQALSYRQHFMPMMQPAPFMFEFLHTLKNKNIRLALCTNRSDSVLPILEHFNLHTTFDPVMTVSKAKPKPHPEGLNTILQIWGLGSSDVAYVGDSLVDQQAAKAAGIPFWSFKNQDLPARLHVNKFSVLWELLSPLLDQTE